MAKRSIRDIEKIWSNVEGVRKLSDRAVGAGPFGVGLDGLLTWVPVVGSAYTVGAAAWLLVQAMKARASPSTVLRMMTYLGVDTVLTVGGEAVPVASDVLDFFFQGHGMAARALQKDIESTHWVEDTEANARASGDHEMHEARVQNDQTLKRIVYLHD